VTFLRLARPLFLGGGAVGVALGTALAAFASQGRVDWRAWLAAQCTVTALQLMTHLANEYFDRDADAGAARTPFSGGSGVLVEGALLPGVALASALAALAFGLGGAVWLASDGHVVAAWIAVAIAALAWVYSAPPLRLSARGLGEIDTALIVGVLVPLCAAAAQSASFDRITLVAVLAPAAAMFAMMLAVEVPDIANDTVSGKRNVVVRAGARTLALARVALVAVYVAIAATVLAGAPLAVAWLALLTVPAAIGLARAFGRDFDEPSQAAAASVAARGVAFFFVVTLAETLGFIVHSPWR
jgi:1,4-dihydroxy-2-naphthoate octaprenyltransferase